MSAMEYQNQKQTARSCGSDASACSPSYIPGMGCTCCAHDASECGCPGVDWTPSEVYKLRDAATYTHAGCTASAMGWAIKYANIRELAVRLIQAKGRFHTQKAFEDLREFISSENESSDGAAGCGPNSP